jgi:hypothetical protein
MKVSRNTKLAGLGAAVVATAGIIAGCAGNPQLDDLRNTSVLYPNYAVTFMNVSSFPNVTELCINGIAFATTTRDYNAILRIPQWDAFCATKIGQTASGVVSQPLPAPYYGG